MVHFKKLVCIKIVQSLPLEKAGNKQFQKEGEVTQQGIISCVKMQA